MSEEVSIFIGKKPRMSYVLACLTAFHEGAKEVKVKARGSAISRAVDVVMLVKNRFMPDVNIKGITIGTDEITVKEGGSRRVSSIEICLEKGVG
ncbi:MAG: DNA-binding protein Alba [Candidatus Methanomethylicota archaeon]|uniref:DNA/RNA-binding protein Alba n=2 Tax=Thermoproteota archaeon TaxID=2056631 RepID=A0A497EML4_9CREN|nr:MAG: DNA-binding protein Alba [Candidatus Verstraetearchaeota archaeon]